MSTLSTLLLRLQWIWAQLLFTFGILFGRLLPPLKVKPRDLTGKTAIVSGANSGIGYSIALQLAQCNASVCLACRNLEKAQAAAQTIQTAVPGAKVSVLQLDTASFESVRSFAASWAASGKGIDVLVHNAGGPGPDKVTYTADGFEVQYQQNFLSSFLLTHLLEPYLAASARVIFTSSTGAYSAGIAPRFSISSVKASLEPGFHHLAGAPSVPESWYYQTKLMQIAFAKMLQRHFDKGQQNATQHRRITSSYSPGLTATPIFDKIEKPDAFFRFVMVFVPYLAIAADEGAKNALYLATSDDRKVLGPGGEYWERFRRGKTNVDFYSQELLDRLWIRWCADAGIEWT